MAVGGLLQSAHIDVCEEIGRIKFGHQHQRAAQRHSPARNANSGAAAVAPGQRQRVEPEHGLIRAHKGRHGTQGAEYAPGGAVPVPPGQDAAPQHGQRQRIVQRFLHGGEHIPDRCVHGRQRQRKHSLAFPVQPRGQGEKRPACRDEQQVAPEERILPAQQQPGQRIDEEHRRAPGRVGAHFGVGLIEAEVSLRCAVPHSGGQLLAVNDLVAPGAGGQENLRDRHFVDGPLVHQQKYQRRSRRAGRLRPAGQAFTVHRTPKLSQ